MIAIISIFFVTVVTILATVMSVLIIIIIMTILFVQQENIPDLGKLGRITSPLIASENLIPLNTSEMQGVG